MKIELDPEARPTVSVDEAAIVLGISRSSAYEAVRSGELPVLQFGRRMRVPTAALVKMLRLEPRRHAVTTVVATTLSKLGGRLDCGHTAEAGQRIFKVDTGERGGSTKQKNGLGSWVCSSCSEDPPEAS